MFSKQVTRWVCDHCHRGFWAKARCRDHEKHCFKNDERQPWKGELSPIAAEGKLTEFPGAMFGDNSPCPGHPWFEWVEHEEMPSWWPGPGKIWDGAEWLEVAGWSYGEPPPGHGCAGGPPPEDRWPWVNTGLPFDPCWEPLDGITPALHRLDYLDSSPRAYIQHRRPLGPETAAAGPGYAGAWE